MKHMKLFHHLTDVVLVLQHNTKITNPKIQLIYPNQQIRPKCLVIGTIFYTVIDVLDFNFIENKRPFFLGQDSQRSPFFWYCLTTTTGRDYGNWERLVDAVLLKEKLRQLALADSISSNFAYEEDSSDFDVYSNSPNIVSHRIIDASQSSRRALSALKALVKLQALVRGHLTRKRSADALRQMQALVRAQTRARVGRVLLSQSPNSGMKSSGQFIYHRNNSKSYGRVSYKPEKSHLNHVWMESRTGERLWEHQGSFTRIMPTDDERGDKILGVNTGKPHTTPSRRNLFHSSHLPTGSDQNYPIFSTSKDSTAHQTVVSPSSGEVQSLSPLKLTKDGVEIAFCTADNGPQFYSASSKGCSSKREVSTCTKSNGSISILSGYSDHSNYMAYTESSKAKVRSLSAPKQRPQYERSSLTKRYSVHGCGDPRSAQRVHELHANFASKAYPGSGRLDRLGMPVRGDVSGFRSGY